MNIHFFNVNPDPPYLKEARLKLFSLSKTSLSDPDSTGPVDPDSEYGSGTPKWKIKKLHVFPELSEGQGTFFSFVYFLNFCQKPKSTRRSALSPN